MPTPQSPTRRRRPVVLGRLGRRRHGAVADQDEAPERLVLETRGGLRIDLDDATGEIRVLTPTGSSCVLGPAGVRLAADGSGLELTGTAATLRSSSTVVVSGSLVRIN